MKAFIIEDEPAARRNLSRLLQENFPDLEITGTTGSVAGAVEWLESHSADIIFMDVELEDGNCFEIFRRVRVDSFVVMTTAYDNYAIKAFEVGSVDYLLKPIELQTLSRAVERCRNAAQHTDVSRLLDALKTTSQGSGRANMGGSRERFLLRIGERIVPVNVSDIAWIESENKSSYLVLHSGERYIFNPSLDEAEAMLDNSSFFRISRSCLISRSAIQSIIRLSGSRLRLVTEPSASLEVARARVDDFLSWME